MGTIYSTWDWWNLFQCRYHWFLLYSKYLQQEKTHLQEKYQKCKNFSKRLAFCWFQQAMGSDLGDIIKHQNFTYGYFWEKISSAAAKNPRGSPRPEKEDSHEMGLEIISGNIPCCVKRHLNSLLAASLMLFLLSIAFFYWKLSAKWHSKHLPFKMK